MLGFLIDNIFDEIGGYFFQLIMGIFIEINWDPLLDDLFVHFYQAEFMHNTITDTTEVITINLQVVLLINDPNFTTWIPFIYTEEFELQETSETTSVTSLLDIYIH